MGIVPSEELQAAETRSRGAFAAIEEALRTGVLTGARAFVTDAFFDRLTVEMKEAAVSGWKREAGSLVEVTMVPATASAEENVVTLRLSGQGDRGWRTPRGELVAGAPGPGWTELWTMARADEPSAEWELSTWRAMSAEEVAALAQTPPPAAAAAPEPAVEAVAPITAPALEAVAGAAAAAEVEPPPVAAAPSAIEQEPEAVGPVAEAPPASPSPRFPLPPIAAADPDDVALATSVAPPLVAYIDAVRSSGSLADAKPYMAPEVFAQEQAHPAVVSSVTGSRELRGARHTHEGSHHVLSVSLSAPGGLTTEEWAFERWDDWGQDAGWLVTAIIRA